MEARYNTLAIYAMDGSSATGWPFIVPRGLKGEQHLVVKGSHHIAHLMSDTCSHMHPYPSQDACCNCNTLVREAAGSSNSRNHKFQSSDAGSRNASKPVGDDEDNRRSSGWFMNLMLQIIDDQIFCLQGSLPQSDCFAMTPEGPISEWEEVLQQGQSGPKEIPAKRCRHIPKRGRVVCVSG